MAGYPTFSDLKTYLQGIDGAIVPSDARLGELVAAAIKEWEARSGWLPFLKDAADQTRFYNPPRCSNDGVVLDLGRGLLVITSLTVGCEWDGTGGTALTLGQDFIMQPYDGGTDEKPWTGIRFRSTQYGGAKSLKIVGKFGYLTDCPADVAGAIKGRAAAIGFKDSAQGVIGQIKQGPVEFDYSVEGGRDASTQLTDEFMTLAGIYRGKAPWL